MTELMSCASLQHAAVWCLAVQAADLALKHSRHVQELEDEINKLQEQLDETNKVCAFIFVILSLCIPHLSAHTHTHARARAHTHTHMPKPIRHTTGSGDSRYSCAAAGGQA